jgi:glutamate racemase
VKQTERPIGVFDSGIGGLTVVSQILRQMPQESVVYFGDTARVPYGSKSREVVTKFSVEIASFLLKSHIKMLVVACNTASAFALVQLKNMLKIPVIGVIEPGARAAADATENGRIGVIGTQGTIASLSYTHAINRIDRSRKVFPMACPLFVPLVEEGWLDNNITYDVAKKYLLPFKMKKIDTLVLGCTHYPLLKKPVQSIVGKGVRLIDSAFSTAQEVKRVLEKEGMANSGIKKPKHVFYVSDSPDKFKAVGEKFLGKPLGKVVRVNVEERS